MKSPITDLQISVPGPDERIVALDEALERLATLSPRQCQVVELRYFVGMTEEEAADVLGVTRRTVDRDWKLARALVAFTVRFMNPEQWSAVSELFHRGLTLSGLERDNLIANNVQDPEIGAHVRDLWKHTGTAEFLERNFWSAIIGGRIPTIIWRGAPFVGRNRAA